MRTPAVAGVVGPTEGGGEAVVDIAAHGAAEHERSGCPSRSLPLPLAAACGQTLLWVKAVTWLLTPISSSDA